MNTKRQTVWLVSMLSLMVILSAYYLFTEDVNKSSDLLTTDGTKQQVQGDATEAAGAAGSTNGIDVTDVTKQVTTPAGTGNLQDTDNKDAVKDAAALSKEDQAVLDKIEASGASSSVFSQLQEKRDQKFKEDYNKVYGVISDTKQDEKTSGQALEQLNQLDDKSDKITGLEEELQKQYNNAAVYPEQNDKYKVVVQSDKLEKSQADSIMMMVIKELGVSADQVSVQYVQ